MAARKRTTTKTNTSVPKKPKNRAPGKRRPSGGLTASERKRSATITVHKPGKRGGAAKERFPMPDKEHARNALARLNQAKNLTPTEKAAIQRRANRMLGKTASGRKKRG